MAKLGRPQPLGLGHAAQEVHSIAAPMLAAAALALAGVVAGANPNTFVWSGPTLLVLVAASLFLVASIQLHYHARHFYYSVQDIDFWYGLDVRRGSEVFKELCHRQQRDFEIWERYIRRAATCFNTGALLLGFGVSLALVPTSGDKQESWRWIALSMVLVGTVADMAWIAHLYGKRAQYADRDAALNELNAVPDEPSEE
ncbi:hypothetical protein [Actinacidiphila sp. bgisy160]|uniref:hypothetical protein n=1 Tax=Actinacidiphila sp. bgisy160 TaxID=3413796 RepID=UPI003D754F50